MADLRFELVTPERLVRSEAVFMVVVPGSEGDFGVLAGHAPLMSTLRNGDIAVYRTSFGDTPERIPVEGGFAEVSAAGLTILAERAGAETDA
ncbi:MAG: ATP synthase F1 subunit epsilon [Allosphingosinicella sp.]